MHHRALPYVIAACAGVLVGSGIMWFISVSNPPPPPVTLPINYYPPESYRVPPEVNNPPAPSPLKLPIIMYHYVEWPTPEDKIRTSLTINPVLFERQLQTLQDYQYRSYFIREIPTLLSSPEKVASRSIALTFDDGYEDFYTFVYPLLQKYRMKATLYVISGFVGYRGFLSEEQLQEMVQSGLVEVGAHTVNHVYLKGMANNIAKDQIEESKRAIEKMTGETVYSFAYPYGAFDQSALTLVREATFSAAVSVIPGIEHSKATTYFLYRIRSGRLGSGEYMHTFLQSLYTNASQEAPLAYP